MTKTAIVGSFDDADRFTSTRPLSPESWHETCLDTKDLPTTRVADNPSAVERWMKAIGKLPD